MFCLHTNIAVAVLRGSRPDVERKVAETFEREGIVVLPVLVVSELIYGVHKSSNPARARAVLDRFLAAPFDIVPFTAADADRAGRIRARLAREGLTIGPYDVLIAAQAMERGLTLVTNNAREFSRIEGLDWTDWLSPSP